MARQRADLDYYVTLGIGTEATEEEIRRTYRRLALAAGAPPVGPRGAVRALRSVSRAARLAG